MRNLVCVIGVCVCVAVSALFAQGRLRGNDAKEELTKPADEKSQATIRYLGHSGIAIKTSKRFLVFDYTNQATSMEDALAGGPAEVIKPSEIKGEDVWFFISHEHQDHWHSGIAGWRKDISKIKYVVSPAVVSAHPSFKNEAGEKNVVVVAPNKSVTVDGVKISTIAATDSGVGFLVGVDGLVIFHAGDHALWDKTMERAYQAEIKEIKAMTKTIDLAFLPLQPNHRNRETITDGALWATKELAPKVVVPIHLFGEYAEGERFVSLVEKQKLDSQPVLMKDTKKTYLYQDGKVKEN